MLMPELAAAIGRVKGAKRHGTRTGNWLTRAQAEQMLALPDRATHKGKRDRALLCLLIGCGLRREELALLLVEHIQQRDARWVLVDLVGKGKRVCTVPMPAWTEMAIDQWMAAAGIAAAGGGRGGDDPAESHLRFRRIAHGAPEGGRPRSQPYEDYRRDGSHRAAAA
jgi:integrase